MLIYGLNINIGAGFNMDGLPIEEFKKGIKIKGGCGTKEDALPDHYCSSYDNDTGVAVFRFTGPVLLTDLPKSFIHNAGNKEKSIIELITNNLN